MIELLANIRRWFSGPTYDPRSPPTLFVNRAGELEVNREELYKSLAYQRQIKALEELTRKAKLKQGE